MRKREREKEIDKICTIEDRNKKRERMFKKMFLLSDNPFKKVMFI